MFRTSAFVANVRHHCRASTPDTLTTCGLSETGNSFSYDDWETKEEWTSNYGQSLLRNLLEPSPPSQEQGGESEGDGARHLESRDDGRLMFGTKLVQGWLTPEGEKWRDEGAENEGAPGPIPPKVFLPVTTIGGGTPLSISGTATIDGERKAAIVVPTPVKVDPSFEVICDNNLQKWNMMANNINLCVEMAKSYAKPLEYNRIFEDLDSLVNDLKLLTITGGMSHRLAVTTCITWIRGRLLKQECMAAGKGELDKLNDQTLCTVRTMMNHMENTMMNDDASNLWYRAPVVVTVEQRTNIIHATQQEDENLDVDPEMEHIMEAGGGLELDNMETDLQRVDTNQWISTTLIGAKCT